MLCSLPILPILLLGLLLTFPSLSVQGALNGLLLWFNVVLPTLAPFIICTQMITALGGVELLMKPFSPFLKGLFQVSIPGSYILLCGLLCGYPLGARMCADFKKSGSISPEESAYLLAICNHPSPMFLLGYVQAQLNLLVSPLWLIACLYLPILPLSFLARFIYRLDVSDKSALSKTPLKSPGQNQISDITKKPSLEDTIASTCETMVIIGGYIMLFSILVVWIDRLTFLPESFRALLAGAAEITTGVSRLCKAFPDSQSLLPVLSAVAFGGFSGIFQTRSVIRGSGLSISHYVGWKFLHASLSCLIALLLPFLLPS
ncbi:MAG: nucleoside recognition protein [Lachnospiraceae bacterium]|nr:nucleoside recognition protein [Lachnospiraceae bacterium]